MNKAEIIKQLHTVAAEFGGYCLSLKDENFFHQPENKWSPAQQTKHLDISTNVAKLAVTLPRLVLKWKFGRANRPSKTYDELVAKYKIKLSQGGKAPKQFAPEPIPASHGKEKLLNSFTLSMDKMAIALEKKWKEEQLDRYIVPHPLLGKITIRELCYFTIYHTRHHLNSIKEIMQKLQTA